MTGIGDVKFPTTPGAFQETATGAIPDAFVAKLNPTGSALVYSTYLGGAGADQGFGIAVDGLGHAYVTGFTGSTNFPTTLGAFQTTLQGSDDAFVTKLNPTGSGLVYSTYLGGSAPDQGFGIAVDAAGNAYATGFTSSANFPTTLGAAQPAFAGKFDAFVTKLNPAGTGLVYSTYLGGAEGDEGRAIAIDAAGHAYVTGWTFGPSFPTTPDAFPSGPGGGSDVFVTKLNLTGSGLIYSVRFGGTGFDQGLGIALDLLPVPNAYVTGITESINFPTTVGAFQTSFKGEFDGFVVKIAEVTPPATVTLEPPAADNPVESEHCVTATVRDAFGTPIPGVTVRFMVTGSINTSGSATTDENGEAVFCYVGPPLPGADIITAYADTDDDNTQDPGEPTGAAEKTWVLPVTTPLCEITITNGGRITAANGDPATFGGNAHSTETGATQGQEEYQDHGPAQPMNVHSINVLAIVCEGSTMASIFGEATVDGSGSFLYRIRVQDFGEPGVGTDTYWLLLQNGYDSGEQTLEGGNVQIRRD